jgi:hypothetical protein
MAQVQLNHNLPPVKKPGTPAPSAPQKVHDPVNAAFTEAEKLLKPLTRLTAYATAWRQAVATGPHGQTLSNLVSSMDAVVGALTEAKEELADLGAQGFKAPKVDLNRKPGLKVGDFVVIKPKLLARWATFVDDPSDLDNLVVERIVNVKDCIIAVSLRIEGHPLLKRLGPIQRCDVTVKGSSK